MPDSNGIFDPNFTLAQQAASPKRRPSPQRQVSDLSQAVANLEIRPQPTRSISREEVSDRIGPWRLKRNSSSTTTIPNSIVECPTYPATPPNPVGESPRKRRYSAPITSYQTSRATEATEVTEMSAFARAMKELDDGCRAAERIMWAVEAWEPPRLVSAGVDRTGRLGEMPVAAPSPTPSPRGSLRVLPVTDPRASHPLPLSPRKRVLVFCRQNTDDCHSAASPSANRSLCVDDPDSPKSHSTSTSLPFNHDLFFGPPPRRGLPAVAMSPSGDQLLDEREKLINNGSSSRQSMESTSSASTTSLVLENLNGVYSTKKAQGNEEYRDEDSDPELPRFRDGVHAHGSHTMSKGLRRVLWILSVVGLSGWLVALAVFILGGRYKHSSTLDYDHDSPMKSSGKKVTLEQIRSGLWNPRSAPIEWIPGPAGEDGLLLEINAPGQDYLVVDDIRNRAAEVAVHEKKTLVKNGYVDFNGTVASIYDFWVSPDMQHVLLLTNREKVFRHSFIGLYYVLNVETQAVEPLDPANGGKVQLATWSPKSDSIVFTRDNNLFVRDIASKRVTQVTTDGGPEYFYGIPDWVYEEEVFQKNSATWWARDGKYLAFLRTNETVVPEYPVQYFLSRPSGEIPPKGLENYPEVRQIKYPKAGAPNPVVDMLFYDVDADEVFTVDIAGGFPDDDRIIYNVLWADNGKVLIYEENRESDFVRVVLVDVEIRSGKTVRTIDYKQVDGGWIEPAQKTVYIPADTKNGRQSDGYVESIVFEGYDHIAYFSPLDSSIPTMLTQGAWEVDDAPEAVDLKNGIVYFVAAKEAPTQRHIYGVKLDGSGMEALVSTDVGHWTGSFSSGAGYINLAYNGPGIPYQKVVSTPINSVKISQVVEDNKELAAMASSHELPHLVFQNVTVDDYVLQVVERFPPHFDPKNKYPVLFYLYGGPGSQVVNRRFHVDFHSYIASSLGYIVVTVDGRGTGYTGRKSRTIIRGQLGKYEAHDQIETAKIWASRSYVDENRLAIWGWSYGGFMTLKVLETDGGQTFKYGMSVAPVTDWRFYDSIYTERYMRMPQNNVDGYDQSAITNVTSIAQNVRFLLMHGVADDNVHMQNTLTLLDRFDLAGIENYDVHVFPDSDHSIFFHNANPVVYDKLNNWLINAFNGEWYRTDHPTPNEQWDGGPAGEKE